MATPQAPRVTEAPSLRIEPEYTFEEARDANATVRRAYSYLSRSYSFVEANDARYILNVAALATGDAMWQAAEAGRLA